MKILLPTDGSHAANDAIDFVRTLAVDNPIEVVVLLVSYLPIQEGTDDSLQEWTAQEKDRIRKLLEQTKQTLEVDCQSVAILHEAGSVVQCILEQAKSLGADLIVLGAKGQSATSLSKLGSVSENIATRAECSVCVVRPKHRLHKLLLAFDESEASSAAVLEWRQLKLDRETQISVVSVARNQQMFIEAGHAASPTPPAPEQIALIRDAAERIASRIAEQYPNTDFQTPVADHVGEAIISAAEKADTDMIIVADAGSDRRGEFFLGSTSKYVLRHASCSVWISRHHWKSMPAM